ncbi:hypothetical protein RHSIM_Rhsim11G0182200 [Rhododendron simsii]|uniref:Uncharacterized protein n=1 Tax=Rhododendron simsii TaxID=118357 RepID=A0A834LAM4_RHOSS|nr:hypothetical protein RHSIM_Rhsim11G0182200 [Rhododendron simsii]
MKASFKNLPIQHVQNVSSRVVMVEGESSQLFEKKDVPSPEVDTETYEMIEKPVDELVEMAGQNRSRREENEENSDCYKPTVISEKQNSHKWSRMDFSKSNLKKTNMQIDIQEKQLHTKERASDFNLDLPNEIASDDSINEEDKSPLQRHEFSFSSQGVSLGKLGSSPPRIVSFKVGGSKRIKATRSYCEDMVVSQSFDNTKWKREHVIEDGYNNPYLFQAPRRRYLDCG